MYYLDVKEYRDAQSSDLDEANVYQQIKKIFSLDWVPCLFHVRNGIIISRYQYLDSDYYGIEDENEMVTVKNQFKSKFFSWMKLNIAFC